MVDWSVTNLSDSDVEEFAQCQFLAFVGNSLHDVVYPSQTAAIDSHRKSLADTGNQAPGNEIVWLKAVDDSTGQLIGGIKVCYYGNEVARTTSPYKLGKSATEDGLDDEERYTRWVLNDFLARRIAGTRYPHACKLTGSLSGNGELLVDCSTVIDMLFVHPDHHRRGVGRALVAHSCAMADEKGLPGIVEASPTGKRTYELCGFVSQMPVTITSDEWPGRPDNLYYWMERKAATSR